MRDDQMERLKSLAEEIGEVCCIECGIEKQYGDFYKKSDRKTGITAKCKDCIKKEMAARYSKNPERQKANSLARYAAYPEKIKEKNAAWRAANPDKCRAMGDSWKAANPDKVKESRDRFNASEKGKEASRHHRRLRRAREVNAGGEVALSDIKEILRMQSGRCACCKTKLNDYHVDHVQPLSTGGSNDKSNIQILCVTCNLSKGARDPISFMQQRGFLL